ncbi:hypothetical protein [Paenibacillus eucommiae]|uniref:Peptidoglycan/xylan/chitin deacetylase (PgdA/CDA1 family) n=1 Tax=Paenibacillus eucommiae TaxID=1355755 RepID=A0ABS4ISD4_9BACL|nr:hypothetical protein [Paenibacillus eucommiae]MBP1990473.1 peptidoglycan/xylan/chitin deacetylase (PgdA/CDA1 family) [Paenibacillus eucommiae]
MRMARLGVLLDQSEAERRWMYGLNVFAYYIEEILAHAGIPFERVEDISEVESGAFDILIAGLVKDDTVSTSVLWNYVEQGGELVSFASLNALATRLGCIWSERASVGYASFGPYYDKAESIRYLQASPWQPIAAANAYLQEEVGELHRGEQAGAVIGAALQRFQIGDGYFDRWAVDIPATIVGFQQGSSPVLEDGVPALDGSAPINEGILKADDRIEMDWEHDRLYTKTGNPYFAYPYADLWRELFIGRLLRKAVDHGLTLPFVGFWPDGVEHVATISHDSDGNVADDALATLAILEELKIQSTWCMIEPGYSKAMYDQIKQAGHELALHYNALDLDNGVWGSEEFDRQLSFFRQAAAIDRVTSNKNHLTRFEGWGELFEWCEVNAVESDQTRGPSKKGNVGFLFGTCHPYFPVAWSNDRNRIYDVLEIGFLTQDLDLASYWSDSSVIVPFLEAVSKVEGVAHFLVHQAHIGTQETVRNSFRQIVAEARRRGYAIWTAKEINDWERARRKIRITDSKDMKAALELGMPLTAHAVIWNPVADSYAPRAWETMETRYGVRCLKQLLSVTGNVDVK